MIKLASVIRFDLEDIVHKYKNEKNIKEIIDPIIQRVRIMSREGLGAVYDGAADFTSSLRSITENGKLNHIYVSFMIPNPPFQTKNGVLIKSKNDVTIELLSKNPYLILGYAFGYINNDQSEFYIDEVVYGDYKKPTVVGGKFILNTISDVVNYLKHNDFQVPIVFSARKSTSFPIIQKHKDFFKKYGYEVASISVDDYLTSFAITEDPNERYYEIVLKPIGNVSKNSDEQRQAGLFRGRPIIKPPGERSLSEQEIEKYILDVEKIIGPIPKINREQFLRDYESRYFLDSNGQQIHEGDIVAQFNRDGSQDLYEIITIADFDAVIVKINEKYDPISETTLLPIEYLNGRVTKVD